MVMGLYVSFGKGLMMWENCWIFWCCWRVERRGGFKFKKKQSINKKNK